MLPRFLLLVLLTATTVFADDAYTQSIDAWRVARVARLTGPDNWLTLVGRHLLKPGANSVGSAEDNSVRLAVGPPYLGTVTLTTDRKVTITPAAGALFEIDGTSAHGPTELVWQGEKPTKVTFGTASFYVMVRGENLYLRVRDSEADTRKHFLGIDYFPTDTAWRVEAQWVPFDPPQSVNITNMIGVTEPAPVPGKAVFTHDGHTVELIPIDEGDGDLFFVLTDLTAGEDTYEASRFLYAPKPKPGEKTVTLDFNRMQNPPCAFTEFATCPLPPKQNHIPFRVTAGEKKYRRAAH